MSKKTAGIVTLVLGGVVLYLLLRFVWLPDALTWRDMRGAFATYRVYHKGHMPADINELIDFARSQQGPWYQESDYQRWADFIYVANLRTNDPSGIPVVIESPEKHKGREGVVGLYGGGKLLLEEDDRRELAERPWLLVADEFQSKAKLEDLKRRIEIVWPEGTKRGRRE